MKIPGQFSMEINTYTFTVLNDGTVPLTGITLSEVSFNGNGSSPSLTTCNSGAPATPLNPGDDYSCQATYTLVGADKVASTTISNTARVVGTYDTDLTVSDEDSA
ncbi:MAG TPA: hypothetical protein VMW24_06230, partial [Sedimentisphaerales bacterium]|nr:hypothetical protein [Sedimentisphaerales bacterium]